jgi:hypothetical protein
MMELVMVRHGETLANKEHIIQVSIYPVWVHWVRQ